MDTANASFPRATLALSQKTNSHSMGNVMNVEERYIADVDRLIPRPDIALDVLCLAQDSSSSVAELAKKIEQDPNMTANMLRMANSSYFGHMKEIASLQDIIVRLGLDMVKILAITSASAGILTSPQEAYDLEPRALWNHSHACSILAEIIARYAKLENHYTVYTAALLHDIGKVVLNKPLLAACAVRKTDKKFSSLLELERFMLQTDHARVGAALLAAWGLPDSITIPVARHHSAGGLKPNRLDVKIVSLANFLVESIGIRSLMPADFHFNVDEFLRQNQGSPEVSSFSANMASIMEEFFNRFSGTDMILA
jgi:putative nucleotidyltransferase with HDIG domain